MPHSPRSPVIEITCALAFSPDGNTLASSGSDREIRLWDLAAGRLTGALRDAHSERIASLVFAPNGKTLYSAGGETIKLWDWHSEQLEATWAAGDPVNALAISPDGQTLAAAQAHGIIRLWSLTEAKLLNTMRGHTSDVVGLAFSPDGLTLASGGRDNTVRLWDPTVGAQASHAKRSSGTRECRRVLPRRLTIGDRQP